MLDVPEALDVPLYSTEKDAVFAFKKEAIPLTLQNDREYSAILDSIDLLNTETGEVQTYYFLDIRQGDKGNVVGHAILGAGGGNDRKLLHTHPVDGDWNRYFSGDPANQGIFNKKFFRHSESGEMGDSNVPTTLGYGGIYVVDSGAEVKLYEGKGESTIGSGNNTHANNKFELKYLSTSI